METENRYIRLPFQSLSVEGCVDRKVEVLKEFLESSTIHGLSYISTATVGNLKYEIGTNIVIRGLTRWYSINQICLLYTSDAADE